MLFLKSSALVLLTSAAALAGGESIPGLSDEVQKVLDKAVKQYASVKSYQDKLVIDFVLDAEGPQAPPTPQTQEIKLTFVRPNKFAFGNSTFNVFSDGKQLWQQVVPIEQYIVGKVPEQVKLSELDVAKMPMFDQLKHPALLVLTGAVQKGSELIGEVVEFSGVSPEVRNGKEGQLVKGTVKLQSANESANVPFTAWFSQKTGLLEEIIYDHTKRVQDQIAQMSMQLKINKYVQRLRFQNVSVDGPIPDSAFTFKPGEYDQKVIELRLPTETEWQQKLLGRPAPDFATEDFEGKKAKLSDFKGRVVLLDFWATWCGPCRMAIPAVQRLSEKYQKEPVTVFGMNSDHPGSDEQVKKFVQDSKLTYRQLRCSERISQSYRISTIPYFVLIDKKGIVQSIVNGYSEDHEEMMAKSIDILLKGGTLTPLKGSTISTAPAVESK